MSVDVVALITSWEPMVDAFRSARSMDFYWDANVQRNEMLEAAQAARKPIDLDALPDILPYAHEHPFSLGRSFLSAKEYYDTLRNHLPAHLQPSLEAIMCTLYPEWPVEDDDLSTDSGAPRDSCVVYALRPSSVRAALERFDAVPWTALEQLNEQHALPTMDEERHVPNYDSFELVLHSQLAWLDQAASSGRGVVAVISQ